MITVRGSAVPPANPTVGDFTIPLPLPSLGQDALRVDSVRVFNESAMSVRVAVVGSVRIGASMQSPIDDYTVARGMATAGYENWEDVPVEQTVYATGSLRIKLQAVSAGATATLSYEVGVTSVKASPELVQSLRQRGMVKR